MVVNFKIAKALKRLGLDKRWYDYEYYYNSLGQLRRCDDDSGEEDEIVECSIEDVEYNHRKCIAAPNVCDVWIWLDTEKNIGINVQKLKEPIKTWWFSIDGIDTSHLNIIKSSQEEALSYAINFLIDNNLIR